MSEMRLISVNSYLATLMMHPVNFRITIQNWTHVRMYAYRKCKKNIIHNKVSIQVLDHGVKRLIGVLSHAKSQVATELHCSTDIENFSDLLDILLIIVGKCCWRWFRQK